MFTPRRFVPPLLRDPTNVDLRELGKAIAEYLAGLDQKGALTISEAQAMLTQLAVGATPFEPNFGVFEMRGGQAKASTSVGEIIGGFFTTDSTSPFGLYVTVTGAASNANRVIALITQEQGVGNGGNIILQQFAGKVGIGGSGSLPTNLLDVFGTFGASGAATFGAAVVITGDLTVNGVNLLCNTATGDAFLVNVATGYIGYSTGAGGTVTQSTNKATTVSLTKPCGQITMNNATLNGDTTVSFTFTNLLIAATDVLVLNHVSGGTPGSYLLNAQCGSGSATINVRNITAGNLSEAIVISFALIKGVTS